MRLLSRRALRAFWNLHKDAERPLRTWAKEVEHADWRSFADLRSAYAAADKVGHQTVFDIGGNKYRLIAVIDYDRHKVFVRAILTHKEYDKGNWKADEFGKDWA